MANEFIIKNGYFSQGNSNVTGSLIVSASGTTNDLLVGDNKLIVTAGGNVGIGTNAPLSYTNYTILTIGDNSASKIGLIKLRSNYNSGDGAEIYQSSAGDVYINKNSSTTSMFISASGNVGIGTTSPLSKFVISNAGAQGMEFGYSSGLTSNYLESFNRSSIVGVDMSYYIANTGAHRFYTDAAERMRITPAGNVGIGTTSPSAKLHVSGGITSTDTIAIEKGASDTIQQGSSVYLIGGSGASYTQLQQGVGRFTIWGYNGSAWGEKFTIDNTSGNVGIGTNTPRKKLEIAGDIITTGTASYYDIGDGSTYDIRPVNYGFGLRLKPNASAGGVSNRNFQIGAWDNLNNYSPLATVDESGNFGIGTTAPNTKLDVNGNTIISGSLSNGLRITASGSYSHAEGYQTVASGSYSHAEGNGTLSIGSVSHAEGQYTTTYGDYSHTEGEDTIARGNGSHAEGFNTIASGSYSHAEGTGSIARGNWSHAEGENTLASGSSSHAEGIDTIASGSYSHAEGTGSIALGYYAHAEGENTLVTGFASHAEGFKTKVSNNWSHAEGANTLVTGIFSHAEGVYSTASGTFGCHAEGYFTLAAGSYSHAEGQNTIASGNGSHAEGYYTTAYSIYSHAAGYYTVASGSYQSVVGQYNRSSSVASAFIIGNGTDDSVRSNLVFASGSTFQVTGSILATGNVGFGTSTPTLRNINYSGLHIHNQVNTSANGTSLKLTNSVTGQGQFDGLELYVDNTGTPAIMNREATALIIGTSGIERMRVTSFGSCSFGGNTSPVHQLQLSVDSAGKPSTNTWTITSDSRIKENIIEADYNICYDIVKNLPLKRYTWKQEAYTIDQVRDRSKLGWIAQDVETVFPKAVEIHPFSGSGDFHIDDCRNLNSDQIYAAMYGTIKKLINENDTLKSEIQAIKTHIGL